MEFCYVRKHLNSVGFLILTFSSSFDHIFYMSLQTDPTSRNDMKNFASFFDLFS